MFMLLDFNAWVAENTAAQSARATAAPKVSSRVAALST
jgi:hypothetical protein